MAALNYDDAKKDFRRMTVTVNGIEYNGMYSDIRVIKSSIPEKLIGYDIRHEDDDDMKPASIKLGNIMVNCFGTFIADRHIYGLDDIQIEIDIDDWDFPDDDDDDVDFFANGCTELSKLNYALRKFVIENGEQFCSPDDVESERTVTMKSGIYLKGYDTTFNRVVADTDPDFDDVVLRAGDIEVCLAVLDNDELRTLIANIEGFEYEF